MMPKISVIIPCYNQGTFLEETIDSVLNQTFQDFEIIVVNDGSTDVETNNIIASLDKPKTRIIQIKNGGSAVARNTGYKASNGEYIQFLDGDDLMDPNKFEKQLSVFRNHPDISICYTNFEYCNTTGKCIGKTFEFDSVLEPNPLEAFLFKWERGLSIAIHSYLIKREVFGDELPFDERLRSKEDWVLWCKLANKGYDFHHIPENLVLYRTHANNKMRNKELVSVNFYKASTIIQGFLKGDLREQFLLESFKHIQNFAYGNSPYKEFYENILNSNSYKLSQLIMKPLRFIRK